MKKSNLRRDPLDYLLTDTTPVEVSEVFTYTYLYNYLHKNQKQLGDILANIRDDEVNTFRSIVPFDRQNTQPRVQRKWLSDPLTFHIVKADGHSKRKMSIPQPLAALNMYFFIHLYQRDILNLLERPVFSVRYHSRNSDLVYRSKSRTALIDYQYKRNKRSKKIIEQTGRFFDVGPFVQAIEVGRSEKWRQANIKFKLFCKLDFKRCFDSVYTHSFKWIATRDVVDSKSFHNSSLFAVIDRVLQNINGASSNGVLVGPEFSRMIVEILLQQIDDEVAASLRMQGIRQGNDFEIIRFVDDIFIFTNDEITQEKITKTIEDKARRYLLEINQLKVEKQPTPYFRGSWIDDVNQYKDKIQTHIRPNKVVAQTEGEEFQIQCDNNDLKQLGGQFEYLLSKYKDNTTTITNFAMSVLMNSMSSKSSKYRFFKTPTHRAIPAFIEYIFFVYSHSINFKNTQKLISILHYCHNEVNLKQSKVLQRVVHKYEKKISEAGYSDYINLLIALDELDVQFSPEIEGKVLADIKDADDPIALATFWSYCKYNQRYMDKVSSEINKILGEKFRAIQQVGDELQYREFWYILIFNKCPYIHPDIQQRYGSMLRKMVREATPHTSDQTIKLLAEFMLDKNEPNGFVSWNVKGARMLEEITYRTHNKTVFQHSASGIVASL